MGFRPEEQRQNIRHALNAPYTDVIVKRLSPDKPNLRGHAYDISMSGTRIELDVPLEAGEFVNLELRLPNFHQRPIHITGRTIRFCSPEEFGPIRMGIMFTNFESLTDYQALARQLGEPVQTSQKMAA